MAERRSVETFAEIDQRLMKLLGTQITNREARIQDAVA